MALSGYAEQEDIQLRLLDEEGDADDILTFQKLLLTLSSGSMLKQSLQQLLKPFQPNFIHKELLPPIYLAHFLLLRGPPA